MPIKHMPTGDQNKEESELRLHFNWECNYCIWLSELSDQIIQFWYTKFIHLVLEELIMWRTKKFQTFEALVFCYDGPYETEEILEWLALCKEALQKKELL